ncbi:hypothetical protein F751_5923 [Auxenochlorella protothecoides]|uniref:BSD domain-containing protein n=1 Tax=Auxenochlorella protothecoides TaxID=3075 RepID=A0A087SQ12_AUXPR|nr:hypothetical protein F751_5923 [Auxenochlorella protothecoides]KFM27816.1 hypothetical protein F751_5923 [Auxenochlorella protothecoides]
MDFFRGALQAAEKAAEIAKNASQQGLGQPVDDQEFLLNPWQIQHATLLCAEAKDIHELRFMLCPRYMTDGHFWHTYFSLMKPHLPAESLTWPMDTPFVNPKPEQPAAPVSSLLSDFRSQIQSLGSQVQAAAHMTSVSGAGPASVGISEEDRGMDEERDSGTTPDLDFDDYLNELAAEGSKEDGGEAADPTTHP